MTDKTKGIIAIVSGIILLAIGVVSIVIARKTNLMTAFEFVEKSGAIKSSVFPGSLEFSGYRFFANNRVARLLDDKKGNYTKEKITFDDGEIVFLTTIFK